MIAPVYLCGGINGRTDAECVAWRQVAKKILPAVIDPMDHDYRGRELDDGVAAEIVGRDKASIRQCVAVLVMYDRPSVGTSMEVFYAHSLGKPVHVVNASAGRLSPWLLHHATTVHQSLEQALRALTEVK